MSAMPPAPDGTVWELSFNSLHDDATLFLCKRSRWTGRAAETIFCAGIHAADKRSFERLKTSTTPVDQIIDGVVVTAHEMIKKMRDTTGRGGELDAKAAEVSRRLGIQVKVRK